jgi:hypothetical protein
VAEFVVSVGRFEEGQDWTDNAFFGHIIEFDKTPTNRAEFVALFRKLADEMESVRLAEVVSEA